MKTGNCKQSVSQTAIPTVQAAWHKDGGSLAGCRVVLQLTNGGNVSSQYGAPATMYLDLTAHPQHLAASAGDSQLVVNATLTIIDKPTTRTTESASVRFAPSTAVVEPASLELHKVASWIGPNTVAENGSKHIHYVSDFGARWNISSASDWSPSVSLTKNVALWH